MPMHMNMVPKISKIQTHERCGRSSLIVVFLHEQILGDHTVFLGKCKAVQCFIYALCLLREIMGKVVSQPCPIAPTHVTAVLTHCCHTQGPEQRINIGQLSA